jgi:hypothetical protein
MHRPAAISARSRCAISTGPIARKPSPTAAHLSFDGQPLRIEFAVTRMDDAKPDTPMTGRRYPACRLVLPPGAAVELINRRSAPR